MKEGNMVKSKFVEGVYGTVREVGGRISVYYIDPQTKMPSLTIAAPLEAMQAYWEVIEELPEGYTVDANGGIDND